MKIVIVAPYFYPHVGGVEVYTLNMAKQLKDRGWQVVIITTNLSKSDKTMDRIDGIKIYRLNVLCKVSNTPVGLFWRRKIKRILKDENPDVINGHTPVPYLADIAERVSGQIPFVLTYHNDIGKDSFLYRLLVGITQTTLTKRTLRRSTKIIATSDYYVNRSTILRPYQSKIEIVSPGVDMSIFNSKVTIGDLKERYSREKVILFVGSLNSTQQHKGVDRLITAFSEVCETENNCKLVIIGEGDAKQTYIDQAKKEGLSKRVEFTGYISNKRLAQYYKMAKMLVMPSTDSNEGFGMVLLEANAVGTPVIGSKVGGIPFVVQHNKTGLLVSPKSVNQLSKAIRLLLDDPEKATELGRAGSKRAARDFDWRILAQKSNLIFTDAMKPTIVQVAGYYPPHLGGMEQVTQTISEELARDNYTVQVLTTNLPQSKEKFDNSVEHLTIKRYKAFEFAHTPISFGILSALFRVPKRSIIHLHLGQAYFPELVWFTSRVKKIPYVVHFHLDLQPSGILGHLFVIYKKTILSFVISHASRVIVFTNDQAKFIQEAYGIPKDRIDIIPNGINGQFFKGPKKTVPKQPFNLLFVGRLTAQKRVNLVIGMLPLLHVKTRLTIIGDGDMEHRLKEQVKKLKLKNVTFTGELSQAEVMKHYDTSDIFIMASQNEGMSLAMLEAMASGLPVVGSNTMGIRDVISGVGMLVDDIDEVSLAEAVNYLLTDEHMLATYAEKSYLTAQKYTWPKSVKAIEKLYQKV